MRLLKFLSILFLATLSFASCSNDDDNPDPVNEEEVITTVTMTLVPDGGGTTVTMEYQDLDGDGPNTPTFDISGPLATNTIYNGTLDLLNETESPAESITGEIEEEDEEHQFFFTATNSLGIFAYTDMDGNGNPIGLAFTFTTTNATTGNINVILRHEPVKDAAGVSDGDLTNAGGETDVDITFMNVSVQ